MNQETKIRISSIITGSGIEIIRIEFSPVLRVPALPASGEGV